MYLLFDNHRHSITACNKNKTLRKYKNINLFILIPYNFLNCPKEYEIL